MASILFLLFASTDYVCDPKTLITNLGNKCEIVVTQKPSFLVRVRSPRGMFTYMECPDNGTHTAQTSMCEIKSFRVVK